MSSIVDRVKDKCIKADYISTHTTGRGCWSLHDMGMTKSKVWSFENDPGE